MDLEGATGGITPLSCSIVPSHIFPANFSWGCLTGTQRKYLRTIAHTCGLLGGEIPKNAAPSRGETWCRFFGFDASENAKATMLLTGVEQASPNFDQNRGEKNRQVGNLLSIRVAARTLY